MSLHAHHAVTVATHKQLRVALVVVVQSYPVAVNVVAQLCLECVRLITALENMLS